MGKENIKKLYESIREEYINESRESLINTVVKLRILSMKISEDYERLEKLFVESVDYGAYLNNLIDSVNEHN